MSAAMVLLMPRPKGEVGEASAGAGAGVDRTAACDSDSKSNGCQDGTCNRIDGRERER